MNMPMPTVTKRTPVPENMTSKELDAFMKKHGFGEKEMADFMGVTIQGVRLWLSGERAISVTNTRLIRLMIKHPSLMKEF
jgi:DNA-binding transcriptional regulator YiaG